MKKITTILILLFSITMFSANITWNGTSWSGGGTPPSFNDNATIAGNYTVGLSDGPTNFICRSLTINAGATFTILTGRYVNVGNGVGGHGDFVNNGTVLVQPSSDFWIYDGALINNSGPANFIIENGGGMVQFGTDVNIGSITIKRDTKPVKLNDYTYWSSPVKDQLYNSLPPMTTGMRIYSYSNTATNYGWGNNLVSTNGTMEKGKGYIAHKGIINDPNPQQVYTMNFIGVPNNGNISTNLTSYIGPRPNSPYLDGSMYLTGNPYPSALDMNSFLTTNNVSTIYLWTHNTIVSSSIAGSDLYNYTPDDYASYNLTGGVAASSPIVDGTPNNTAIPTRYIGSGQGFFVKAPTLGSKTFNFTNTMRGYLPITTNTQFYKQDQPQPIVYNRIWLFLTNNFNITRYNMFGYVTNATNDFDHQYDATIVDGRIAAIYSLLNDKKLVIEGKALPFDENDMIPLGIKIPNNEGGSYQIGLNDVDGLFTDVSQPIYIEDLQLGIIHNLRTSSYSFTITSGTNETRFRIRFTNTTLGNNDNVLINSNTVIYSDNGINIKNNLEKIKNVIIFDVVGKQVHNGTYNDNSVNVQLNTSKGVYIVKVSFENGSTLTRKIIY